MPLISNVLLKAWWRIAAIVGGGLWAAKSLAILVTGTQPDYLFELGPSALAIASFGLALAQRRQGARNLIPVGLGVLAMAAAITAGVSYIVLGNDEGLFGPAMIVAMISIIVVLFWVGRSLWRTRSGEHWRAIPYLLAWGIVAALPLGALMSGINERLLEVPLLAISLGWIWLGTASLASAIRVEAKAK